MRPDFPIEPSTKHLVLNGTNNADLKIRYGANRWGRTEWIGRLYPERTKESQFLAIYVQYFNSIELQTTHYATYPPDRVRRWTAKAEGRDFLFCPKFPQTISHYSSFVDIQDQTNRFLDSIYALEDHLGPVVLQVSEKLSSKKRDRVFNYLQSLPQNLQVFLEVRNPDWFDPSVFDETLAFLRQNGIGLIISDHEARPLFFDLTVAKCWIRYTPSGDFARLDQWYKTIKEWGHSGLQEAYFFVQEGHDGHQQLEELLYFKNLVDNG